MTMRNANLQSDIKRLVKKARKKGMARDTLGLHYRVFLYMPPRSPRTRIVVIPMPPQPVDGGKAKDPTGSPWEIGAQVTRHLIGGHLGSGQWVEEEPPEQDEDVLPRLAFLHSWCTDPS